MKKPAHLPFAGQTLAFAGTLGCMNRNEARAMSEHLGARTTAQISKQTTRVILGRHPGAAKQARIAELGIPAMSEREWFAIIRKGRPA